MAYQDRCTGQKETRRLNLPTNFSAMQVFPLTEALDWILCLAKREMDMDDPHKELESDGVHYLFGLSLHLKCMCLN